MPFRHVALYRWADHVDEVHVERLSEALDALPSEVPGIRSLTHGPDAGVSASSCDYLVVIDVDSMASWRSLRDHPAYILLVEELITGHTTERADGQLRLDDGDAVVPEEIDVREMSDNDLMAHARKAAQAGMDALLSEPDDVL